MLSIPAENSQLEARGFMEIKVTVSAARCTALSFGVLAGLGGLTHGIGEVLQGSVRPDGLIINSWTKGPIATNMGHARNALIAQAADVLIAVGGGYGTLSEIALARKMGKSVVALRSWKPDDTVVAAESADEAVSAAERKLSSLGGTN